MQFQILDMYYTIVGVTSVSIFSLYRLPDFSAVTKIASREGHCSDLRTDERLNESHLEVGRNVTYQQFVSQQHAAADVL